MPTRRHRPQLIPPPSCCILSSKRHYVDPASIAGARLLRREDWLLLRLPRALHTFAPRPCCDHRSHEDRHRDDRQSEPRYLDICSRDRRVDNRAGREVEANHRDTRTQLEREEDPNDCAACARSACRFPTEPYFPSALCRPPTFAAPSRAVQVDNFEEEEQPRPEFLASYNHGRWMWHEEKKKGVMEKMNGFYGPGTPLARTNPV